MKKHLAPLAVSALLLTGCGGGTEPAAVPASSEPAVTTEAATFEPTQEATTEPPEPEALGPGAYAFETPYGTTGTMEVPGEPLPEVEALREMVGADPVTYITATIDNRQGEEAFDFYQVSIYDPAGNEYTYTPASEYIFEIMPEDMPTDQYNGYVDLSNEMVSVVDPLQQAESVLVGPAMPDEITGVVVSNGFESFDATPAE